VSASAESESLDRQALSTLESAVSRLLAEAERLRARTALAETRVRDVESLLRRFTKGEEDPARLQRRVTDLRAENRELRKRIEEGGEAVDRLLARIRFLEEQQ
jgi:predicted RNase H-like nuclease (RuvC/YqgF family)